ncbi:asparagine synthase (glutamine-hydrolyzing) [bacterium LRH843]|nr:asparagine synthase (glutamine-hydrolyzing) [bacterium LRH843]
MVGFVAFIHENAAKQADKLNEKVNKMMSHRGPDHVNIMKDAHIEMGVCQLAKDETEMALQPLSYEGGRYWIVYDGGIYNDKELRMELLQKGKVFKTKSDTEVLLALYSLEGKDMVQRLRGSFAFVIWDNLTKTVFAARDRFGIKPLFYVERDGFLQMASEKKCIVATVDDWNVNEQALQHYLSFQYVPEPMTMTESIMKIEPGFYVEKSIGEELKLTQYWKPAFNRVNRSEENWVKIIQETMIESIRLHMKKDTSIGTFLSGGIDSTIIASIAKQIKPDIETFSVGFENNGYSEIEVAKETAAKLNIVNHSAVITAEEYVNELPKIMWHMDDPLADPACVPLYFAAKEARKKVGTILSGEGADELFGGYNIYREPHSLCFFRYMPLFLKRTVRKMANYLPDGQRGKSFLLRGTTPLQERYIGNANIFLEEEKRNILKNYNPSLSNQMVTSRFYEETFGQDPVQKMQHIDICTWLRGDILVKADRMTMAHSLDVRVPFLDSHVFEIASCIPTKWKTANGTTKYMLRQAFKGIVPDHVYMRKKLGFPVPLKVWLKDELYNWAHTLISECETDQYLNKSYLSKLLDDHVQNKADYSRKIWTALTFIIWHQVYVEQKYDISKWIPEKKAESKVESIIS